MSLFDFSNLCIECCVRPKMALCDRCSQCQRAYVNRMVMAPIKAAKQRARANERLARAANQYNAAVAQSVLLNKKNDRVFEETMQAFQYGQQRYTAETAAPQALPSFESLFVFQPGAARKPSAARAPPSAASAAARPDPVMEDLSRRVASVNLRTN